MTIQKTIYVFFVTFLLVQSKHFVYVDLHGSFDQANIFCKNEFPNGRLAIMKDEVSVKAYKDFLFNSKYGKCF